VTIHELDLLDVDISRKELCLGYHDDTGLIFYFYDLIDIIKERSYFPAPYDGHCFA
jgi:hypothetical protein